MNDIIVFIEKHWGIILALTGTVGSVAWLKLDARYARKSDVSQLQSGQSDIIERLDLVEQDVKHLPSSADVTSLRVAIQEMKGDTKSLGESVKGLNRLVSLLVEKEVKKEGKN